MPGPSSSAGRVRAKTTNRSAMGALVMKRLSPLMIQSASSREPSRTALVRRPDGFDPAPGSVSANERHLAGGHPLEPLRLLLVGAEPDEHLAGDAVVGAEHRPQGKRGVAQLHCQLDVLGQVQAETAPLLGDRVAEQAHLRGLRRAGRRGPGRRRGSPARGGRPRCGRNDGSGPGFPGNPRRSTSAVVMSDVLLFASGPVAEEIIYEI